MLNINLKIVDIKNITIFIFLIMTIDFTLNTNCIKQIPIDKYSKDFIFCVDGKNYQICRITADLVSLFIRQHHCIDPSMNEFYI